MAARVDGWWSPAFAGLVASCSGRAAQRLVDVVQSHIYDPSPVYGGAGFVARAGCAESLGLICCAAVQSESGNTRVEGGNDFVPGIERHCFNNG